MNYTNGDIAKLLEFAGVDTTPRCKWCGWSKASCDEKAICLLTNGGIHCVEPMPPLTGDFRDHVAMECLRRLPNFRLSKFHISKDYGCYIQQAIFYLVGEHDDPADAIFTAVLAYLKEQEGK